MAVTKILARKAKVDVGIRYILNGEKTQERVLTAGQRHAAARMMKTKQQFNKTDGVQYYHLLLSFKPGEVKPQQALEIAEEFAKEHLPEHEVVMAVHTDKEHIHAHMIVNSVNAVTGKKYHSNARSYYSQIRATADRLCREHGLSVIVAGEPEEPGRAVSYAEWLRQSRGQSTFRSMLEADLRAAIREANSLGHFYALMERMGYEIKHGNRLSFRLRGQERYLCPGRKNPLFTEEGILAAIHGNLEDVERGLRHARIYRPPYRPYRQYKQYTGFLRLYVHYLYILGKIEKREFPPKMTPKMRRDVMRFEQLRAEFKFIRDHDVNTPEKMLAYQKRTEERLAALLKQRIILNARKKKRKKLYAALSDAEALEPAVRPYQDGLTGLEREYARYQEAVKTLERSRIPRERLAEEQAQIYEDVSEINRQIRAERKNLAMCQSIRERLPTMERSIKRIEEREGVSRT